MTKDSTISKMKEISEKLREASKAYYQDAAEIMSNFEYDALYDELEKLEKESGIVLSGSPTQTVGYEVLSDLPKEKHPSKMLSLDKTKEVPALEAWLGEQKGVLSWKMDGLTVVLTYEGGELIKAVTRGNGEIGEVITQNAKMFDNLPLTIPYQGRLVVRGEAVIKYSDFEKINAQITEGEAKYKNPRNLCSGSVRQLDPGITKSRHVNLFAFSLVSAEGDSAFPMDSRAKQFEALKSLGFEVVEYVMVQNQAITGAATTESGDATTVATVATVGADEAAKTLTMDEAVEWFSGRINENDFPSDGLVLLFDDIEYGKSLGTTAKFPRDAIAFKWKDETAETILKEIEWSASRTGLINPVAIFEPVELEGTTVSRASVHNISILKELKLGIGDSITVYKANMIIPQIAENLTQSGNLEIPETCPVCGGKAIIKKEADAEVLFCENPSCLAKHVKSIEHFVSRDALNIEGMSEATVEKFIDMGIIKEMADLFKLSAHRDTIVNMEGFGEKSFNNMVEAAKKAALTTPERLLYGLGVEGIGVANAKVISKACGRDWIRLQNLKIDDLTAINGVGDVLADSYVKFFENEENRLVVEHLLEVITFEEIEENTSEQTLEGKTFVITGSLNNFANRKDLQALIEERGGKVAGSVSNKTSYLINNDNLSSSTKNKTAKSLGVPIITEVEFLSMLGGGNSPVAAPDDYDVAEIANEAAPDDRDAAEETAIAHGAEEQLSLF